MSNNTIHGKSGLCYIAQTSTITSGALIGEAKSWKFTMDTDLLEITVFGDFWKSWQAQPMKWEGTVEGNFNVNDNNTWGVIKNSVINPGQTNSWITLFPDKANLSNFYQGLIWPRLSVTVDMTKTSHFTLDFTGDGPLTSYP